MKIYLTGASGFVGSYLEKDLQIKLAIDLFTPNLREGLTFEELSQSDCIIHLAGKAHDLKKSADPAIYDEVNYELTKKLYDAFLRSKAHKFIFISSVKAAADSTTETLTEAHQPDPKTHYGFSKLKAEQYIQSQLLPEGKAFYILRPCMIHGPGNKGNLNLLYQLVKKGVPYPLASFQNSRSFLSIANLSFLLQEFLKQKNIPSGVYQLADDEALSTNDLVSVIAETLNKKPRLWAIPKPFIFGLAKVGDILTLPLNSERLQKLTENYVISNAKVKAALRVELPIQAREGLQQTIRSFS